MKIGVRFGKKYSGVQNEPDVRIFIIYAAFFMKDNQIDVTDY